MRPQRQQVFRTDATSKLDDLELVAALLIRDITSTRAFITERGIRVPAKRAVGAGLTRRWYRSAAVTAISRARRVAFGIGALFFERRIGRTLRAMSDCAIDLAIVLVAIVMGVVALTLALLVTVPPA